jgi:cellulose synthase/poly-beta-1,6-N-acetylglucosamine synthase-like glycosyltransferase
LWGDAVAEYGDYEVTVSIIVPAFNAGHEITRTIESVLYQDLEGIELIVVDDGSTDDTFDVARAAVEHSTVAGRIIRQENSGVSAARNIGLEEAMGHYVLFLDADDFIARKCLSKLYGKAESCNADIVFCGWDRVDATGALLESYDQRYQYFEEPITGRQAIVEMLRKHAWICTGSGLYRKDLLDEHCIRFTVGCTGGEDTEFTLKAVFHAKRLASVSEALSNYVQRPKGHSLKLDVAEKRGLDSLSAHYRLMEYLERQGAEQELVSIMESYVVGWMLPGTIASLASCGRHYQEVADLIERHSVGRCKLSASAFDWMSSWKCRAKAALGNWLLSLNPKLFYLVARLRGHR